MYFRILTRHVSGIAEYCRDSKSDCVLLRLLQFIYFIIILLQAVARKPDTIAFGRYAVSLFIPAVEKLSLCLQKRNATCERSIKTVLQYN